MLQEEVFQLAESRGGTAFIFTCVLRRFHADCGYMSRNNQVFGWRSEHKDKKKLI